MRRRGTLCSINITRRSRGSCFSSPAISATKTRKRFARKRFYRWCEIYLHFRVEVHFRPGCCGSRRTRRWIFGKKREPRNEVETQCTSQSMQAESDDEPPIDPPSRNPGPDALLQIAETSRLVRESLDRLGEPCREIIELRYYGDLSYDEIAAELRLNPKTVSSRLSKCLDRLLIIAKEIFPPDNRLPSNL